MICVLSATLWFALKHVQSDLKCAPFFLASQMISGTLVCDRFRFKWKHLPPVFTIVCDIDKTDADSFRWSQTVTSHMETRL